MNAMQILIGFLVYKKGRFSGDYLPPGVQIPFIDKKPETCSFSFSASAPFQRRRGTTQRIAPHSRP